MRRRWFRTNLAAPLLLSLTLLFGCAWQGHVKQGDAFMAAANYDAAAAEYAEALRLRPGDEEIASKLAEAQAGQVEERSKRAHAALDGNDTAQAIALTAEAYTILPNHPTTVALIEHVVAVAGQRAKASADAGQFHEAMAIYDAILDGLPSVRDRVAAEAQPVIEAWIAHLNKAITEAEAAGRSASVLLYKSQIAELTGNVLDRNAAREQVAGKLRYLVVVKAKSNDAGATAVAALLAGKQPGTLLEIASEGEPASATLSLTIGKPKFAEDKQKREQQQQYQSGTQQVPNEFYKMAQDDVLAEEQRVIEREKEVTKQEEYVTQYSAEVAREGDTPGVTTGMEQNLSNAQSRLEAARRALEDQRNVLARAREKAASTPQMKEEPIYSTHTFTVSTYIVTATVKLEAKLVHADGRAPVAIDQPLSVSAQDDTHEAQSVAGVAEDPLTLPSKDELANQVYAQAGPLLTAAIHESFAAHRQAVLTAANAVTDPAQKLEQLLTYVLLDPRTVDAQVVTEILTLSGVPDAAVLLGKP
jgi:tetratricopeptide (TPR) repeat protein